MPYQYDGPITYDDPWVSYDGVSLRPPIKQPCYVARRRARTWGVESTGREYVRRLARKRVFVARRECPSRSGEGAVTVQWPAKDAAEEIVCTFDFAPELDVEGISEAVCAVDVESGDDPAPASILEGSPTISGGSVLQRVIAGVDGTSYTLRCRATLSPTGRVLVLAAVLPVRRA